MKALIKLAVLAVLVGGGYFGFKILDDKKWGIEGAAPLGSFEVLDLHLTEDIGLDKSESPRLPVRDIASTERMYRYTNPENQYESVTLLLDGANNVRGIVGVYWLGDYGSRSPVMLFSQSYWRKMGGAREPELTETRSGSITVAEARFETESVAGAWKEWIEQGQKQVTIHLQPW